MERGGLPDEFSSTQFDYQNKGCLQNKSHEIIHLNLSLTVSCIIFLTTLTLSGYGEETQWGPPQDESQFIACSYMSVWGFSTFLKVDISAFSKTYFSLYFSYFLILKK